ncbi:MAG TPA: electron transfer flavoprotein subunit alpha/FixB family protein [Propionibacteriaceae bacterium]|jgi:electron transfer flavoprotein alpha subunit|nr:electron transfer flavoprotein subunit alpha/FixB family protein [Propionibacteriaceae bacterium]
MSEVLIVAEHINSHVSKPALELLTLARRLGQPVAVVFGDIEDTITKALGEYGATRVLSVNDPAIEDYLVAPKAEALAEIAETVQPAVILITSTPEGKEIAGRLAVKLGSGLITDASDVAADGTTMQSVFAGNWTVTASVTRGAPVITVKPNAVAIEAAPTEPVTEQIEVTISDAAKTARILSKEPKRSSGRPDLTEAAVVVSGGRGTGGDFAAVEELADVLGGAVGASRAAVDAGWYPYAYQIGQTGKTVSPQLYIAVGISGAIQHRAGMQTSKAIVAVNKDPEAPIFALADLGIVGDLHKVLPDVINKINKRSG